MANAKWIGVCGGMLLLLSAAQSNAENKIVRSLKNWLGKKGQRSGDSDSSSVQKQRVQRLEMTNEPTMKTPTRGPTLSPGYKLENAADVKVYIEGRPDPVLLPTNLNPRSGVFLPAVAKIEDRKVDLQVVSDGKTSYLTAVQTIWHTLSGPGVSMYSKRFVLGVIDRPLEPGATQISIKPLQGNTEKLDRLSHDFAEDLHDNAVEVHGL